MKAIILVGGFGTRLRPLTYATPKQMLPVVGRPMIERVVGKLGEYGVTDAILSLGYRPDKFIDSYPDDLCAGVRLHYAVEPEPLDTAGAVRFAAVDAGIDGTFLVLNGDVLTDLDVGALWRFHEQSAAEATIALTPVDDPSRFGVVAIEGVGQGRVVAFVEKPPRDEAPSNWINAGTYVLEPSVIDRIPAGRKVSIERETFPAIVADGGLFAVQSDAYWVDAGTPETYLEVQLDLIDGKRGAPEAALLPGARIQEGAVVEHTVVHEGARVEPGAVVRDSVLMHDAVVESGAAVSRSIIGSGSVVGRGATLAELSVLGDHVRVDPGAVLRGARIPAPEP